MGGLRFRSTTTRFFKFVWCFHHEVSHQFSLRNPFLKKIWWKTAEPRVHREGTDPR
jgi:hypothetical protein